MKSWYYFSLLSEASRVKFGSVRWTVTIIKFVRIGTQAYPWIKSLLKYLPLINEQK